MKIQWPNNQSV